ncbi:sensor domain-containing protein [Shinella granuli]|uniref:PAS domain S-box-containing protein/diguanylate cyclase (GGDEF)-like protein n=1 Tax=Shinella granuli TaxID=323621 RepID=A0A4R2CN25_SHIGR|nr:bifunctional diguanylate cyclase/phosphodiesterase [Shinella granuli]TCN40569.1 PAS domain S-box-containing protein/diguanylate cyclase (GGDEF)-like protein [Shinella granuli]
MAKPSGSTSIAVHETEREPFYRRLFARSGFGFAALDAEGRILEANGAFLRPFGVSCPSTLPPFPDCVSPKDRAVIAFAMRPGPAEQAPWEIRLQRPDGTEFWVLASFVEAPVLPGEPPAPALLIQTTDIDERKRNALELAERESRWNHALESAGQGVWDHDFARGDLFYSRQWRAIRGLQPDDPIESSLEDWLQCVHPDDRAHVLEEIHKQETGQTPFNVFSYRERHKDGHFVWIESRGAVVDYGPDGKPSRIAGTDTDITERKEAEERLAQLSRRLELALGVSRIGVFDVNLQTGDVRWDNRMIEMYGVTEKPDAGTWERALHPQDQSKAKAKVSDSLFRSQDFANEFRIIRGDGEIRHIRSRAAPYVDMAGAPRLIGVNWDITDDMRLQEELQHAKELAEARNAELEAARARIEYTALHDHLTGLPNRRYLDAAIEAAAREAKQSGSRLAVLHIDLDRFKEINDTLGHLAGDQMLVHAAGVLNELKGPGDFVARIGGDEFVFLSTGSAGRNLAMLAEAIVAAMRKPVTFNGHICRFGASVGIASQSGDAIDAKQLLVNADLALYRAKNRGRSRHEFFTSDFQAQIIVNKKTADEILTGIEQQRFLPYYQPQFCARTLDVVGVETLARWDHPTRGILAPDTFLKIAEDLDCVAMIDRIVLEKSLADYACWQALDLGIEKISVNVSSKRLHDPELARSLQTLAIRPKSLSFELLESIFLDDCDRTVLENLAEMRKLGIDIEIDDFGTGHASIISLMKLSPRRLKIDRQLVKPVSRSPGQRKLVGTIVEIGRSLNIEVVAEGVETSAHVAIMRDLGCDILQGYALARPMPAGAIPEFVQRQEWRHQGGNARDLQNEVRRAVTR